jgi:hypothetical protein
MFCAEQKINVYLDAKKWNVVGFLVWEIRLRFRYFIGLTFQAGPFHRLSVGRTANNHLLSANHDYDVANPGSRITLDGNLRRGEHLADACVGGQELLLVGPPVIGGEAGGPDTR